MKQSFHIPPEFRAFMREVAAKLEWIDDRTALLGPDALEHECGRGGRVEGTDVYRFMYFATDGHGRSEIELSASQIRAIADDQLDEVEAAELEPGTSSRRGEPLLVWGEYDVDALRVRSLIDLEVALDALHAIGGITPCVIRLWSTSDDQVVAVLDGNQGALYVVGSSKGYGTSVGDPTHEGSFDAVDHDIGAFAVLWSHCVPWRVVRASLLRFAESGDLGEGVILDGSIPSQLLMLGDVDRAAELQMRRPPPANPALSSLPGKTPHGDWARRLLDTLVEIRLIELDPSMDETITGWLSMLLTQWGQEAQDSIEAAHTFAKELGKLRGVVGLFATGGDLQIALRRTQDPPTMPVEVPFR